jgi:integrin beta 3
VTFEELGAVVRGIAPVIKEHATKALESFTARLTALEARAPLQGPPGEKGLDGAAGRDGVAGINGQDGAAGQDGQPGAVGEKGDQGPAGPQGEAGPPGPAGERGEKGLDGTAGERGPEGLQGIAGRDGLPGVQGPAGEKGISGQDGKDGAAGKDGRDGTLENIKVLFDNERTVTLCFKDGTPIEGGVLKFPVVIYRGVYGADGRKSYERCDSVTFGNQSWIAMEDTTEKPGEGKSWRLAVRRGQDGREGKPGKDGADGKNGKDAIGSGFRTQ